jgi:hypothetical protein
MDKIIILDDCVDEIEMDEKYKLLFNKRHTQIVTFQPPTIFQIEQGLFYEPIPTSIRNNVDHYFIYKKEFPVVEDMD